MIINLGKQKLTVKRSVVPEPLHRMFVQYVFEHNSNHLTPKLYIGKAVYIGNRVTIDMDTATKTIKSGHKVPIRVELVDDSGTILYTYRGNIPCHKYCLFGTRLVRPNFENYIKDLEAHIEKLENEGEVILYGNCCISCTRYTRWIA